MITKQYELTESPLLPDVLPEDALFFDIETTGLSPYHSEIYLIGAVSANDRGAFTLTQFFSERFSEEETVIHSFFELGSKRKTWISFNGDAFDLLFLKAAARQYGLDDSVLQKPGIDLLKSAKVASKLFPEALPSCRQKAVESFLGIARDDLYNGGELIRVYHEYLKDPDPNLLRLLLLHNRDDLLGLTKIMPIRSYETFFRSIPENVACKEENGGIALTAALPYAFPRSYEKTLKNGVFVSLRDHLATVRVPVEHRTLKRFFPDYRNYFYLPSEGYAVHKMIAKAVDKDHRVPAKKDTAFALYESDFVVSCSKSGALYRETYDSSDSYIDLKEFDAVTYFREVFRSVMEL